MDQNTPEDPLLRDSEDAKIELYIGDHSVDLHGNPSVKNKTGNWRACGFILGTQCCEALANYGITVSLVTYLTKELHLDNAAAAKNATTWLGTCFLTPLLGALLADSYLGRYWTTALFFIPYFSGILTLALSTSVSTLRPVACVDDICPKASDLQYGVSFIALYLIALGTGGTKPCVSSFGADQFDDTDPIERQNKGSFFNWLYFTINLGGLFASSVFVWVEDNISWGWGFGIQTVFIAIAIISIFSGTPFYRFQKPGGSPLIRIFQVIIVALRNSEKEVPRDACLLYEVRDKHSAVRGSRKIEHTNDFKFLDKAAIITYDSEMYSRDFCSWELCTVTQVEELKILLRMFPIWISGIIFSLVYAQMPTMFVEQGTVMDRSVGSFFSIPPASLSLFDILNVIVWIPIYDRILVPISRKYTCEERGFTSLQRMGIGLVASILAIVAAATVEIVRLIVVRQHDLVHDTITTVPMSILWQIPQYCLFGAAEVFFLIGQIEFFYEQSPDAMRSLCSALSLLSIALGNYLSSLLVTIVTSVSTRGGNPGWIPDNLNEGHLDYYFLLLVVVSLFNLLLYIVCACKYKYKKAN